MNSWVQPQRARQGVIKSLADRGGRETSESVRAAALPTATLAVATARSRGRRVVAHAPKLRRLPLPNALFARRRSRCTLAAAAAGRVQTSRGGSLAPDNERSAGRRRWSRLIICCDRLSRSISCRCAGRCRGRRARWRRSRPSMKSAAAKVVMVARRSFPLTSVRDRRQAPTSDACQRARFGAYGQEGALALAIEAFEEQTCCQHVSSLRSLT